MEAANALPTPHTPTHPLKRREEMFVEAAKALARLVGDEDRAEGALLPPVYMLRETAGARWRGVAGFGGWAGMRAPPPLASAPPTPPSLTLPSPTPPPRAAHVAAAVAGKGYHAGVATELPKPHDLLAQAHSWMYNPRYRRYR